ncbi:MAG: TolC family protein [Alphaproteobacteria bacterium]|nr:MAG: TolC family protein [Alphaproteobacteria bacterium]
MAVFASACGHLPIAEPAFEAMSEKRAGMPADWTVAPMTGDPAAVISDYSVFNDAQLTSFVQEALENNRGLRAAIESVRQSELALQSTRSGLFPQIGASLGARTSAPTDDLGSNTDSYSFALNGRYDVDIMGDLNASIQAAGAGLRSTEAVYEQTRRQIAAQVARAYFAVIEGQLQLELDRQSIDRQRQTFRITQTRFDAGSIARDELVLGESNLAQAEDSVIASEASLRAAVRALELALGRFPQNKLNIQGALPEPPTTPPLGLPELTVRSRPDVVAAELNMIQTFANTRIASMAPWPQIGADITLGLQNQTLNTTSDLFDFDGLALSIGASLAQVIFDGGAVDARVKTANSQERAALERYGQTVINAYGDIVGAIDTFNTLGSRNVALEKASTAATEVLRLGELKYQEGSESLLNLFTVRNSAENAQSALISNRRARLDQWITLHTALGGNPTQSTPLATPASTANGK